MKKTIKQERDKKNNSTIKLFKQIFVFTFIF